MVFIGILFAVSVVSAWASGPPAIYITTAEAGTTYRLIDYNRRAKRGVKTLKEVADWCGERAKEHAGDICFLYPDDRTPFQTVVGLIRQLHSVGVKLVEVGTSESGAEDDTFYYLEVKSNMVRTSKRRVSENER